METLSWWREMWYFSLRQKSEQGWKNKFHPLTKYPKIFLKYRWYGFNEFRYISRALPAQQKKNCQSKKKIESCLFLKVDTKYQSDKPRDQLFDLLNMSLLSDAYFSYSLIICVLYSYNPVLILLLLYNDIKDTKALKWKHSGYYFRWKIESTNPNALTNKVGQFYRP